MKKFIEVLLAFLTILTIPGIIQLGSKDFYETYNKYIWLITLILAITISITQINFQSNCVINKLLRRFRYSFFKTKNIIGILFLQLLITLIITHLKGLEFNNEILTISLSINLLGLNLLIFTGKIKNNDSKEILLHDINSGKIYLLKKNRLKHIPDPPTFNLLGYDWASPIKVKSEELSIYKKEAPITSIKEMKLINHKSTIYGLVNDKLKHIPDMHTLNYILSQRENKNIESKENIDEYIIDTPFKSYKR